MSSTAPASPCFCSACLRKRRVPRLLEREDWVYQTPPRIYGARRSFLPVQGLFNLYSSSGDETEDLPALELAPRAIKRRRIFPEREVIVISSDSDDDFVFRGPPRARPSVFASVASSSSSSSSSGVFSGSSASSSSSPPPVVSPTPSNRPYGPQRDHGPFVYGQEEVTTTDTASEDEYP